MSHRFTQITQMLLSFCCGSALLGATTGLADAAGKAGQGNSPNPPAWFERHNVVKANGVIYDPSYAVGPFADRKDHELTTFAGRIFPQGNHRRLEPLPPSDGNPANDGDLMHVYEEVNFP